MMTSSLFFLILTYYPYSQPDRARVKLRVRTCTTKVRACVLDHAAVLFVGTVPTPLLHHWLAGPLPLGGAAAGARPLPCKSYVSPKAPQAPKLASTVTSWARRALYCMRHDPQGASSLYLIQQFAKHNDNIKKDK